MTEVSEHNRTYQPFMSKLSGAAKLAALDNSGIKIDTTTGRLMDWADRPPDVAPPILRESGARRQAFFKEQEHFLLQWCTAAEEEGVFGNRVFEQLACVRPDHSWPAYEGKWRKGAVQERPRPILAIDEPFPNLDRPGGIETLSAESPRETFRESSPHTPQHTVRHSTPLSESSLSTTIGDISYNSLRVDTMKTICQKLDVADTEEFKEWLAQPWVVDAYIELASASLDSRRVDQAAVLAAGETLDLADTGRAPHRWKVDRAVSALKATDSFYTGYHVDKTRWTEDDHEVRFITRLVMAGRAEGRCWQTLQQHEHLEMLCFKAVWLASWLRWVHRFSLGAGRDMERVRRRKAEWLTFLHDLRAQRRQADDTGQGMAATNSPPALRRLGTDSPSPPSPPTYMLSPFSPTAISPSPVTESANSRPRDRLVSPSPPSNLPASLRLSPDAEQASQDGSKSPHPSSHIQQPATTPESLDMRQVPKLDPSQASHNSSISSELHFLESPSAPHPAIDHDSPALRPTIITGEVSEEKLPVPVYRMPQAKQKRQQKALFWLTEDALVAYRNHRNLRLASWGVTAAHRGTCILVPGEWANVTPVDLVDIFTSQDCPRTEEMFIRLRLHLGDMSAAWTRAAVWFETSLRRGIDLDVFLTGRDGPYPEMHGSHLCHHGLCINPSHAVYEGKFKNFSRNSCAWFARQLRLYGASIPERCKKHEPGCMMQHAALTPVEAMHIQFSILRRARGLPPMSQPPQPADHPQNYLTFEYQLPLQMEASAVTLNEANLAQPPGPLHTTDLKADNLRCRFCSRVQRVWSKITAYWSHIKLQHTELPRSQRLAEVRRSAKTLADWVQLRGYNYERDNPNTWAKILQTEADNFSWEVFEGWRLHEDRFYEGPSEPERGGPGVAPG